MFEDKRIEVLKSKISSLLEKNAKLQKRIEELEAQNAEMSDLVKAAESYTEEHKQNMYVLNAARDRYDIAYKQMVKLKKEYEKRMNELLKQLK